MKVIQKIKKNINSLEKISDLNKSYNELNLQDGGARLSDAEKDAILQGARDGLAAKYDGNIKGIIDQRRAGLQKNIIDTEQIVQNKIDNITASVRLELINLEREVARLTGENVALDSIINKSLQENAAEIARDVQENTRAKILYEQLAVDEGNVRNKVAAAAAAAAAPRAPPRAPRGAPRGAPPGALPGALPVAPLG